METHLKTSLQNKSIKAYSLKEIASIYEVTSKTMRAWLRPHHKKIGKKLGRYYNPAQVKLIFEFLGVPSQILDED